MINKAGLRSVCLTFGILCLLTCYVQASSAQPEHVHDSFREEVSQVQQLKKTPFNDRIQKLLRNSKVQEEAIQKNDSQKNLETEIKAVTNIIVMAAATEIAPNISGELIAVAFLAAFVLAYICVNYWLKKQFVVLGQDNFEQLPIKAIKFDQKFNLPQIEKMIERADDSAEEENPSQRSKMQIQQSSVFVEQEPKVKTEVPQETSQAKEVQHQTSNLQVIQTDQNQQQNSSQKQMQKDQIINFDQLFQNSEKWNPKVNKVVGKRKNSSGAQKIKKAKITNMEQCVRLY
ncbi:UNKNOWN [Stylonychia lemnae]|uniref:Transmembrane protein n=1 Tax=Stylonychia lemnae TaxID=5949 RepID=A0A078ABK4_STYLE|nr:UNKNOWN [Stylonychia lemnae]|eukprot:CDW79251.1 UNKNOWN [Stylonychia lemnae]